MLRSIFVAIILVFGFTASLGGPFNALLFYLWLAYFRPEGWLHSNWVGDLRLSLVSGVLVIAMSVFNPRDLKPRLNLGTALLLAALVQTFISATDSIAPGWSWAWWIEFSRVILIGMFITMLVNTAARLRATILMVALALGFEAVKQGWVQLFVNPGGTNNNPHLVLGDNNGVALGMFMLAPLVGALVATSSNVLERRWHTFFLGGVVLRGLSTYSRGGMLSAIAVGIHATARAKHRFRVLIGVSVLAGILLAVMPQAFWDRMSTITASEGERDSSSTGRLYFWEVASTMAAENPLSGVGFNAFTKAYDLYDTTGGRYGNERAVHSTWFGMLAENGYPGLFILVSLLLYAFRVTGRAVRRTARRDDLRELNAMARGVQGSLIAFVIGGSLLNGHYSELLWHVSALAIALDGITTDRMLDDVTEVMTPPHNNYATT